MVKNSLAVVAPSVVLRYGAVVEVEPLSADYLVVLVAFARYQDRRVGAGSLDGAGDGAFASGLALAIAVGAELGAGVDIFYYHLRVLAARVVAGDDYSVGVARRDRAHERALACIAVAAATEHQA